MKKPNMIALLGAVILMFALAACSAGGDTPEDVAQQTEGVAEKTGNAFTDSFNAEWHKSFISSCAVEAGKAGVPQDVAQEKCTCAADDLHKRLDGVMEKSNPPREKIEAAMKACIG